MQVSSAALLKTVNALDIIVLCKARYDEPHGFSGPMLAQAKDLVQRGFLETNPTAPRMYRCTEKGESVRSLFLACSVFTDSREKGMLRFREFDKNDWVAYSGCAPFSNTHEPLIAKITVDGCSGTAILDTDGLYIEWPGILEGEGGSIEGVENSSDIKFVDWSVENAHRALTFITDEMKSESLLSIHGASTNGASR